MEKAGQSGRLSGLFICCFLGVSADTGQGAALSLFQHRKQGPGKGEPRARGKFFIAFFSF